jgi:hypothetical protein
MISSITEDGVLPGNTVSRQLFKCHVKCKKQLEGVAGCKCCRSTLDAKVYYLAIRVFPYLEGEETGLLGPDFP